MAARDILALRNQQSPYGTPTPPPYPGDGLQPGESYDRSHPLTGAYSPTAVAPPYPGDGLQPGESYDRSHPFAGIYNPNATPPVPGAPIGGGALAGAIGGGSPSPSGPANTQYNSAFDSGFQAGFVAATGGDMSSVPSIVLSSAQDRVAFQTGFDAGYASGSGSTPGLLASVDPNAPVTPTTNTPVVPYGSSATGLNMTEAARLWEGNQRLAISLSGAAQPGTPGYASISDMNFDPQNILVAAGVSTADPAANWQNAMDMYYTMTRAGGSMPNAGALLTNMAYAEPGTEFDAAIREDPGAFYEIGMQVMIASGASGYAVNAFQQQMSRLYEAYGQYQLTSNSSDAVLPFNQWLVAFHPNVVASWSEG